MNKNPKKIDYSRSFLKQFKKTPLEIKIAFRNKLKLFIDNPFSPQLKNHQLTGKLASYRSINITGDWRALYSQPIDKSRREIVIFEMLGTHSQLYK